MKKEIIVPMAGESIVEVDIAKWHKQNGDYVNVEEILLEIDTDKASLEIVAPVSGVLSIAVNEGDTVKVSSVVGSIDTTAKPPPKPPDVKPVTQASNKTLHASTTSATSATTTSSSPAMGHPSPAANKHMLQLGISKEQITNTGKGGRITKQDVQVVMNSASALSGERKTSLTKMSRIRKTIAKRLLEVKQTKAMLTTFNEIDMHQIIAIRKKYKESFKDKHQVGLGFMSFFIKAACNALLEFPVINAAIKGEEIEYHHYCDIGVAVSTDKGLIVPVLPNAHCMNFAQIESTLIDLATRARAGSISMEEMIGGTFTITNGGVFGSMLSTPIINGEQSAILGLHNIVERPIAMDGEVHIRPMMYVALSYDHCLVDGADSVRFLVRIKEQLEDPNRLLIEV